MNDLKRKASRERQRRWRERNRDAYLARHRAEQRRYYAADPQKWLQRVLRWQEENPEKVFEYKRRSAARRRGAPVREGAESILAIDTETATLTPTELADPTGYYALVLDGDPCAYCGAPTEHVDHIEPVGQGGEHHWSNLTAACARCNGVKRDWSLLEGLALSEARLD